MAIKTELLNDGTLIKHFSDSGFMLRQNETGALYSDPIDIVPCQYTYTETDIPVDDETGEDTVSGEEFIQMLEGVL